MHAHRAAGGQRHQQQERRPSRVCRRVGSTGNASFASVSGAVKDAPVASVCNSGTRRCQPFGPSPRAAARTIFPVATVTTRSETDHVRNPSPPPSRFVHAAEAAGEAADAPLQDRVGIRTRRRPAHGDHRTRARYRRRRTVTRCCSASPAPAKTVHHGQSDRGGAKADPDLAPNKPSPRSSTARSKKLLPRQRRRILRQLLRYYQPEAYVPRTDTYIEKDAQINEQIDRMRATPPRRRCWSGMMS